MKSKSAADGSLADLIYEEGTTLGLDADLLDLVFVEK
jgi:hypothetical protein